MKPFATALLAALVLVVPALAQRAPQVQVQVVNKAQSPVPVQDDSSARNAFQMAFFMDLATNNISIPIPAGKRLVVEHVSISGVVSDPRGPFLPTIHLAAGLTGFASSGVGLSITTLLPLPKPTNPNTVVANNSVKVYADVLTVGWDLDNNIPNPAVMNLRVSITGYLVTL